MTQNSLLSTVRAGTRVVGGLAEVAIAQARTSVQSNVTKNPLLSLGVQLAGLIEDFVAGARTDPNMVLDLVRSEVERSVNRLGFATAAEVDALKQQLDVLQRALDEAESPLRGRPTPSANAHEPASSRPTSKGAVPSQSAATAKKSATTKKSAAPKRSTSAKRPAAKKSPAAQKTGTAKKAATERAEATGTSVSPTEQASSTPQPEDSQ